MTRSILRAAAALTLAGTVACNDSTGVQPEDLAGTWTATSAIFTSTANPPVSLDLIAAGASLTATIQSSGAISITTTEPVSGVSDTDNGTIAVSGTSVTLTIDGDVVTGTITRDGDTLTLNLSSGVEFDFDDDGTDDPATAIIVFVKT